MHRSMIALFIMSVIIVLNIGLGTGLLAAGGSTLLAALNSQNIYVLAGLEMILVLLAYVVAKHEPLPTPS